MVISGSLEGTGFCFITGHGGESSKSESQLLLQVWTTHMPSHESSQWMLSSTGVSCFGLFSNWLKCGHSQKRQRWHHMKPHWYNSETNFGIPECCSKVTKHLWFWVELPLIKVNAVLFGRASLAFQRSVDVLWAAKAANQMAFPSFSALVCGFTKVAIVVSACSLRRQCLITDLQRP